MVPGDTDLHTGGNHLSTPHQVSRTLLGSHLCCRDKPETKNPIMWPSILIKQMQNWKLSFLAQQVDDLSHRETTGSIMIVLLCVGSGQAAKPACQHWSFHRGQTGVCCTCDLQGDSSIWLGIACWASTAHMCCHHRSTSFFFPFSNRCVESFSVFSCSCICDTFTSFTNVSSRLKYLLCNLFNLFNNPQSFYLQSDKLKTNAVCLCNIYRGFSSTRSF